MKKYILSLILTIGCFAAPITQEQISSSTQKLKDMGITEVKKHDLETQIKNQGLLFQGNDFITKEEYTNISTMIKKINKAHEGPHHFILYLTSSSVPNNTIMNILHSLAILQDNGYNIYSKQYLIGPPDDFQGYMMKFKSDLEKLHPTLGVQEKIKRNFGLKIDPRFFYKYNVKSVPMIIPATCPNVTPNPDECITHYYMTGDIGLVKFLDRISEKEKAFEPLVNILRTNGF